MVNQVTLMDKQMMTLTTTIPLDDDNGNDIYNHNNSHHHTNGRVGSHKNNFKVVTVAKTQQSMVK
jgi:hypothetical protein